MGTVIDVVFALFISFWIGLAAFDLICPKDKRQVAVNRITAIIVVLAYSSVVMSALFVPWPKFSLTLFLLQGELVGVISMGIIYGIAQIIHWAVKGKWMES